MYTYSHVSHIPCMYIYTAYIICIVGIFPGKVPKKIILPQHYSYRGLYVNCCIAIVVFE